MSTTSHLPERSLHPRRNVGGTFVAWVLLLMGIGTFTPCVLYPIWQSNRDLQLAQRLEQQRVAAMQSRVDHERRLLDALRNDPAVVARLARRDLGIKANNDRTVRVDVPRQHSRSEHVFNPRPDFASVMAEETPPDYFDTALATVFHDAGNRRVLMVMSVALMGVALWMPNRRMTRRTRGPSSRRATQPAFRT